MIASITINRCSPDSKDPSYSSRGHDPQITSNRERRHAGLGGWIDTEAGIVDFLSTYAPEIDPHGPRQLVGDDPDNYFLAGRDHRGYRTSVQVWIRRDRTAEEANASYARYLEQCRTRTYR